MYMYMYMYVCTCMYVCILYYTKSLIMVTRNLRGVSIYSVYCMRDNNCMATYRTQKVAEIFC